MFLRAPSLSYLIIIYILKFHHIPVCTNLDLVLLYGERYHPTSDIDSPTSVVPALTYFVGPYKYTGYVCVVVLVGFYFLAL